MNGSNHNKYKMVLYIMVNGKIIKEMEEENKYGKMGPFIKEYSKMIWLMVKED